MGEFDATAIEHEQGFHHKLLLYNVVFYSIRLVRKMSHKFLNLRFLIISEIQSGKILNVWIQYHHTTLNKREERATTNE